MRGVEMVELRLLGAVELRRADGARVVLGPPQQRALLAVLAMAPGVAVPVETLIDRVWSDEPPLNVRDTVYAYVSRLRRVFRQAAGDAGPAAPALRRRDGGYVLDIAPHLVDLHRARDLAQRARTAPEVPEGPAHRADLLREATALWRGTPLAGLTGEWAGRVRVSLEQEQTTLLTDRFAAELALGRHASVADELLACTLEHPLAEPLAEQLMLALYRAGRQADALAAYARIRESLVSALGEEPGPALRRLHERVLRRDPGLDHRPGPAPDAEETPPEETGRRVARPAQLPRDVPGFTGRKPYLEQLEQTLRPGAGGVAVVVGPGGVGKTTLAVHWAHRAAGRFPDGQLYVDLQGAGSGPAEPAAVLGAFLRALGAADEELPREVGERAALYRSLLDGRRMLVVLDNARDAAQVRPLLPGAPECATVITSRARLSDLDGARRVDLAVMDPVEATALFTHIAGERRAAAEPAAVTDVIEACGRLPLAVRIAAARLAARPTWPTHLLADKLTDHHRRLSELRVGDQAVEAALDLSYRQLAPEQARALRLLGLPDGPDISLPAAAALLDRDPAATEHLLEALTDASLLEASAPGRYRFHDLIRLYARAQAEQDQPPEDRRAATTRLLDFYLATAATAYTIQRPGDRTAEHLAAGHLAAGQRHGPEFATAEAAVTWLFDEADGLLASARNATGPATLRKAADLLLAATDLTWSATASATFAHTATALLEAARDGAGPDVRCRLHYALGQACLSSRDFEAADGHARRVVELSTAAGDTVLRARAMNMRGGIATERGQYEQAERHYREALAAYRRDPEGNRLGEATALGNLSRVHEHLGRTDAAIRMAEDCLAVLRALRPRPGRQIGNAQYALGTALSAAGRHRDALTHLTDAHRNFRLYGQRWWEALTLYRMARTHLAMDEPDRAAALAEQALDRLGDSSVTERRADIHAVLGHALHRTGRTDEARVHWQHALDIYTRHDSPDAAGIRRLLV
ncbi:AfsR/SARP family transcriptional regulator [Streptomyces litchfieldiae]|uniref:BTAD domain-containing putative transcriptional regulator n=1 Tax=Streptomyces litchfieldiae TaxID=3075543 RepID=A0ABU2MLF2_9ACTN|nr:BTAD domain-containing putative transcriptional regulator [Streptomyces sp. DSM 44938]MDT0342442.1 BTAD domain-containing putative transcriptional regulator [Streptomyces sp. DSM 44938]